jgi:rRNA maturation protein Nop10
MKTCHACKNELTVCRIVGRRDVCPRCGADLHCCLNCSFYERHASKQCREPVAELVKDKGRANFCDYYSMSEEVPGDGTSAVNALARKKLDDLFKK